MLTLKKFTEMRDEVLKQPECMLMHLIHQKTIV